MLCIFWRILTSCGNTRNTNQTINATTFHPSLADVEMNHCNKSPGTLSTPRLAEWPFASSTHHCVDEGQLMHGTTSSKTKPPCCSSGRPRPGKVFTVCNREKKMGDGTYGSGSTEVWSKQTTVWNYLEFLNWLYGPLQRHERERRLYQIYFCKNRRFTHTWLFFRCHKLSPLSFHRLSFWIYQ